MNKWQYKRLETNGNESKSELHLAKPEKNLHSVWFLKETFSGSFNTVFFGGSVQLNMADSAVNDWNHLTLLTVHIKWLFILALSVLRSNTSSEVFGFLGYFTSVRFGLVFSMALWTSYLILFPAFVVVSHASLLVHQAAQLNNTLSH